MLVRLMVKVKAVVPASPSVSTALPTVKRLSKTVVGSSRLSLLGLGSVTKAMVLTKAVLVMTSLTPASTVPVMTQVRTVPAGMSLMTHSKGSGRE